MSDTPASWQPDPTGRHDHRYWDGTQWTDHVADAGVAGTDPYDGPATADEGGAGEAAEPEAAAAPTWSGGTADDAPAEAAQEPAPDDTTADAAPDATDVAASEAPIVSAGWGAPAAEPEPDPTPAADDATTEAPATTSGWARPDEPAPAVSTWSSPSPTGWSATGAGAGTSAEDETAVTEAAAGDVTAATPTSSWGDTTSTWSTAAPPIADEGTAPPPPTGPVAPEDRGGRGKVLLLVLALLVIVGVIVALVLTSDDEDDGDAGAIADRISSTLQEDLDMESGPADCIGEHIVDEIGAARLQDVDFDAEEAPADLEDDFNSAFEDAIGACDLSPSDLGSAGDGGDEGDGDGGDEGDGASGDVGFDDPEQFAALLTESYESTLGLPEDKAACLAEQMVDAVASGELSEDQAFGEFFQYLDSCQISLEELNPTTVPG